jgi:GT2 family glycosyltransferase
MIDIIIVNWNSGDYLRKCVTSILAGAQQQDLVSQIIVIDNASEDDSILRMPHSAKIMLIQNQHNAGFAKACNQGFHQSNAPYVLLLNPDAELMANTLHDSLAFMSQHHYIDILGCQLLDEMGKVTTSCARFPTPYRFFMDALGLSYLFPRVFKPALLMKDWDHMESRVVDQVMGAFMFMRRRVFEKIGYFDERYFVYYEELDFSKRLKEAQGVSYFHASIQARHQGMGTTESVKAFRLFLNLSSRLKYAQKHFSYFGYLLVVFSVFPLELISRFFLLLFKGRLAEVNDLLKGYRLLLFGKK